MINEMLRQFAPLSDISQGSVTTHFRCGWIFSDGIIANFLVILTVKQFRQVALRDRARHLSVEIMQLQNISLENPIVWHYLRDCTSVSYTHLTLPTIYSV